MRSVNNMISHHVLPEVRFNKLLISVAVKSTAWLVDFFTMIYDLRLQHIFRQHLLNSDIQFREIEGIILLKSTFGIGHTGFYLIFGLIDALFQELTSLVRSESILVQ